MKKETKYIIYAAALALAIYVLAKAAQYGKKRMDSPFKYFNWSEFDSKGDPGSGQEHMNPEFVRILDDVRQCAGFPFFITSGYRTPEHNAAVGGVPGSSHVKGLAVDIAAITESQKTTIAQCAIRHGITRIGWGNTFIHLDMDPDKTQHITWGYGNSFPSFSDLTQNLA